jgi:hypothetical protein
MQSSGPDGEETFNLRYFVCDKAHRNRVRDQSSFISEMRLMYVADHLS